MKTQYFVCMCPRQVPLDLLTLFLNISIMEVIGNEILFQLSCYLDKLNTSSVVALFIIIRLCL